MNKIRILFLATHPKEVASTRYRVLAYEPALRQRGYEIRFHPFFPSESLEAIYAPGRWAAKTRWLVSGTLERLRILRREPYDLLFIHRELFPLGGFRPDNWDDLGFWGKVTGQLHHMFLPVVCYMVGAFATQTILTKNSLMETLGQDYVRTAFAKGLSERRVIFVHALRNSLIPLVTGLGNAISLVLAGSFLIERVFNIDGMGYLGYTAILQRDYPVALGILVVSSLLMLVGNILSDIIYAIVDPRIRFQ